MYTMDTLVGSLDTQAQITNQVGSLVHGQSFLIGSDPTHVALVMERHRRSGACVMGRIPLMYEGNEATNWHENHQSHLVDGGTLRANVCGTRAAFCLCCTARTGACCGSCSQGVTRSGISSGRDGQTARREAGRGHEDTQSWGVHITGICSRGG